MGRNVHNISYSWYFVLCTTTFRLSRSWRFAVSDCQYMWCTNVRRSWDNNVECKISEFLTEHSKCIASQREMATVIFLPCFLLQISHVNNKFTAAFVVKWWPLQWHGIRHSRFLNSVPNSLQIPHISPISNLSRTSLIYPTVWEVETYSGRSISGICGITNNWRRHIEHYYLAKTIASYSQIKRDLLISTMLVTCHLIIVWTGRNGRFDRWW
jgi:hypothetical protein